MTNHFYLTQRKRTKFIIKQRKEAIFLCKYIEELSRKRISARTANILEKVHVYAPTAAVGGFSETNEGIVGNPIRGGETPSDS